MVTKRRTYRRRRRQLTDEEFDCIVQFLKLGECTADPKSDLRSDIYFREFPSDEQLVEYWEKMREEILAEYISQHPGTRPWAWWHFEAPEPRRMVGDPKEVGLEPDDSPPDRSYKWKLYFGMPRNFRFLTKCIVSGFGLNSENDARFESLFETQAAYLERLGLLMPEERRTLLES